MYKNLVEMLINSSVDGILAFDRECRYTLWNPAMEKLSGFSAEEVIGRCAFEVFPFLIEMGEDQYFYEALKGNSVTSTDRAFAIPQTGHKGFFEARYAPVHDEGGEIVGGLGIIRDITERKAREEERTLLIQEQTARREAELAERLYLEELRESEKSFRQLAEDLREQREVVETVNRIGQILSAELDLQKLVQAVTDAATELTGARFGSFFYNVLDERGASYMLYTLSGVPREAFAHFPMPRATDLFGPTFRGEGILRIDDVKRDPRYGRNSPYYGMPAGHLPVTSYLAVPIISRSGEVIGGLFFGHPEAGIFSEHAEQLVIGLAAQAAVAMDNARLYDAARRERALLEESENRYRSLADAMPQIVWTARPDGHLDYYNRRWFEYTGFTEEESFAEEGWKGVLHPDDVEPCRARWYNCVQTGEEFKCELRFKRASDGSYRWHLGRALPMRDHDGQILKWFGTSTDIDDQKRAEEDNARLYREAQEANRAKDEFLATVSHELRTPLTAVLGWARILRSGSIDEATSVRALETIERNANAQAQLVEDLLDVSRIITGKLRLEVRPVELKSVIDLAIEAVRPAAEAKGVRLHVTLDPLAGPISGDPDRLQQVVWNLLANAVKFTPRDGRVEVRLERINSSVRITVSDTGIGIKPEFLPFVFERFRQADGTSTRQYSGLGLGLAIVRHLVELHGGQVQASSPGEQQGTTFTVELPLIVAAVESDETEERGLLSTTGTLAEFDTTQMLEGLRVLVVDDEEDARSLISTILEQRGAEVTSVESAAEALDALPRFRPDVILSDIEMPNEDGYSLIKKIRELDARDGGRTPAAALTAYARTEDRMRALLAGFQIHLPKPIEPAELIAVVANLAERTGKAISTEHGSRTGVDQ